MSNNAMIWGASGGIGRALVQKLTDTGWRVTAISRHVEGLADIADSVIEADPTDKFQVQQAVMEAAQQTDSVDLLIYAAGDILAEPIADMDASTWRRIVDANLSGPFLVTNASLPLLTEQAHLIFIGAQYERLQLPGLAAYASAKAALEAFATTLAKEQRKRRISVVRPGAVATPLWEKVPLKLPKNAQAPEAVAEQILELYASGSKGTVDI
jgi:3-oxoacyl-[acyl-carrier protein] reductase